MAVRSIAGPSRVVASATVAAAENLRRTFEVIDAIRAENPVLTERPALGFTLAEYATHRGVCAATAEGQVRRMLRSKEIVRCRVLLPGVDGRMVAQWVYSPK